MKVFRSYLSPINDGTTSYKNDQMKALSSYLHDNKSLMYRLIILLKATTSTKVASPVMICSAAVVGHTGRVYSQ